MLNNQAQMHSKPLQKSNLKNSRSNWGFDWYKVDNKIKQTSPRNTSKTVERETEILKERNITIEKRQEIIDELRLI